MNPLRGNRRIDSRQRLLIIGLLLVLFARLLGGARAASITFDEGLHLVTGYVNMRTGDLRLEPLHAHPPLAIGLSAAPLLLFPDIPDPRALDGWDPPSQSALAEALIWQYPNQRGLLIAGRMANILLTMVLAAVVFRWATDLFGSRAGLLALALCALDPNIAAHGALVTTDMPVTALGFTALFLAWRARAGRWPEILVTGVVLGAALASKLSAALLAPVISLLLLIAWAPRFKWAPALARLVVVGGLAFLVIWASYGFEISVVPGWGLALPAGTHIHLYQLLQTVNAGEHPFFLMGEVASGGWWTYFPIAFAIKTPAPILALLVISIVVATRQGYRQWYRELPLMLFPLIYAVAALNTSINLGYRHLLPLLPCLYVFVSRLAIWDGSLGRRSKVWQWGRRFAGGVALAWLILSAVAIFPDHLAYFNELVGGPAQGRHFLVDSNLDWGQWLWDLRDYVTENDIDHVYISQFTPSEPAHYDLTYDFVYPSPRAVPFAPFEPAAGAYAIGATPLEGVYTPDVNTFAWFRTRDPEAVLSHGAAFVYTVPERPPTQWVAICAAPVPLLTSDFVLQQFDATIARTVLIDCYQTWLYVPESGPGAVVIAPDAAPPWGAALALAGRTREGTPAFSVYRVDGMAPIDLYRQSAQRLDGPLDFLGANIPADALRPGDTLDIWTVWQVRESAGRLLSLMAHLIGPEGIPIALGDGLGLQIEYWKPGDVIVQRHRLVTPMETVPGTYAVNVGAYWLDPLERWTNTEGSEVFVSQTIEISAP